jgi:hypothetical protein
MGEVDWDFLREQLRLLREEMASFRKDVETRAVPLRLLQSMFSTLLGHEIGALRRGIDRGTLLPAAVQ